MSGKISSLQSARRKKRQKTGWSMAEIQKRAAEERALYEKLAVNEPDVITCGGDMSKILDEPEDEREEPEGDRDEPDGDR